MRLRIDPWPKMAATRSKFATPTRPQLREPTIIRTSDSQATGPRLLVLSEREEREAVDEVVTGMTEDSLSRGSDSTVRAGASASGQGVRNNRAPSACIPTGCGRPFTWAAPRYRSHG